MPLRQGMDQQRTLVEEKAASANATTTFLRWKDKETKVLRFLTQADEIFFLKVHDYVPCLDGKNRSFICASEDERDCELCANPDPKVAKVRELGYGIAVEREQIKGQPGDYADVVVQDDKGVERPNVGIIIQAWNNFWKYVDAYYQKFGSLRDLDLDVTRSGASLTTEYTVIPNTPKAIYMDVYKEFAPDLSAMLERMVSAPYYAQHLHGIKPEGSDNESAPVANDSEEAAAKAEYEALAARFGKN